MQKQDLEELKRAVFIRQTGLREIYNAHKSASLFDYANSWKVFGKVEDLAVLEAKALVRELYGELVSSEVAAQLEGFSLVSTIDHHGIIGHPFFLNSNLIFSLNRKLKYLICFSTAGVSLNNSSFPAGLPYTDNDGKFSKINLFPNSKKMLSVFAAPPVSQQGIATAFKQMARINLSPEDKEKIRQLVKDGLSLPQASSAPNFSIQASRISSFFWNKFFPAAPQLIYLPIEDLATRLIAKLELKDILYRLFFTEGGWNLVEKYFQGALGGFTSQHKGSFLFWAIDERGRRVHLHREGNKLVGSQITIELKPDVIFNLLEKRKIYCSSLACFLVVALKSNFTCLGGFNQTTWLTQIKEKFIALLSELGEGELAKTLSQRETLNFAEMNLAFLVKNKKIIKASGLDVYLTGQDWHEKYVTLSKSLTVGESIESLLPEIYKIIISAEQRLPSFYELTDVDILEANGGLKKIRSTLG